MTSTAEGAIAIRRIETGALVRQCEDLAVEELAAEPDAHDWQGQTCAICGGGFSARSWDERHTVPWGRHAGEDCHARCCPAPECHVSRRQRQLAQREALMEV